MKKKYWPIVLFVCAALLVLGFLVRLLADYMVAYPYGSAPLYVYVLVRAVEFILPAVLCLIAGGLLNRRMKKQENDL